MPLSDQSKNQNDPLDESINKLETMIDETEGQNPAEQVPILSPQDDNENPPLTVPILDEVVTTEIETQAPPAPEATGSGVSEDQLLGLIDNLENRLTGVLESLVKAMKDEVIDTLSDEVKEQLNHYQEKLESREQSERKSVNEPDYSHFDGYRPYGK